MQVIFREGKKISRAHRGPAAPQLNFFFSLNLFFWISQLFNPPPPQKVTNKKVWARHFNMFKWTLKYVNNEKTKGPWVTLLTWKTSISLPINKKGHSYDHSMQADWLKVAVIYPEFGPVVLENIFICRQCNFAVCYYFLLKKGVALHLNKL